MTKLKKATLDDEKIKQLLREKKSWDDLVLSIDAAKIHLEAFIATHKSYFFGPGAIIGGATEAAKGIASFLTVPGAPGTQGILPLAPGAAGTPTATTAQSIILEDAKKTNAALLKQAEIIRAGGKLQAELAADEKKYTEAVKEGRGEEAVALAKKIESLKETIKLIKEETSAALKGSAAFTRMMNEATLRPGRPKLGGSGSGEGEDRPRRFD